MGMRLGVMPQDDGVLFPRYSPSPFPSPSETPPTLPLVLILTPTCSRLMTHCLPQILGKRMQCRLHGQKVPALLGFGPCVWGRPLVHEGYSR